MGCEIRARDTMRDILLCMCAGKAVEKSQRKSDQHADYMESRKVDCTEARVGHEARPRAGSPLRVRSILYTYLVNHVI